jgi:acyl-CoA synthetase (AMP-forming)/AMP-acid ligase II
MDRGIGSWVTARARLAPEAVAFVEAGAETTYGEFAERTDRLGRALLELGVRRGDRVGVLLLNSVAFMEVVFATAKVGAIAVPINFRLQGPEIAYILDDAGCDVFVYHQPLADLARAARAGSSGRVRHRLVVDTPPEWPAAVPRSLLADELAYADVLEGGDDRALDMDVDAREVHGIMYTSGTTGRPKGAMLTHANALANARNAVLLPRGPRPTDVTVTAAPMFHIGGLGVHSLPLFWVGGRNVIVPTFDPPAFLSALAEYRVTVQFLVPAMWAALMRVPEFDQYDLSALEMCLSGGAPTPLPIIEFFNDRGITFQEGFGMTETAPSVTVLMPEHIRAKLGSIGRPLQYVETRLVDDDDRDVAVGEVGELLIRGENVFAGYWMLPEATAEAFRGGWFHSGDLGKVDEDGFITLVDRKKDMIISGGENVYPVEVEQVLVRHPAVREVAVFGVPDDRWGETVVAAVACDADVTAEELIGFSRERLAHFKCPTRIEVLDELPRNATGKVLKRELRATFGSTESAVSR